MFNFSANHLLLLQRMEYRSCVVFLMLDHSTHRVYRLYDFTRPWSSHQANTIACSESSTAPTNFTWSWKRSSRTPSTGGLPQPQFLRTARKVNPMA